MGKFEIKALWEIIRPANCLFGALTPVIALLATVRFESILISDIDLLIFCIKAFLIYVLVAAPSNVVNDIYDIEVDRVNRPDRVLPRGAMTSPQAKIYVVIMYSLAVILASTINLIALAGAVVFSFIGYFYAVKGKEMGPIGNLFVSISFSFGLLYGSLIISLTSTISPPVIFYFITSSALLYGREVIKGAEDVEGDKLRDVKTIARSYGFKVSAIVAAFCNTIGNIAFTLLWVFSLVGPYFVWVLIPANLAVFLSSFLILKNPDQKSAATKASFADKVGAYLGILGFLFGALEPTLWPLKLLFGLI
ncbi:MAG: geranylgeranylglycerol-phosphate geranylgeranyltransferase [Candidatus Ranarchaeia archaeon]|jgi:geranylgeranylglycerol-phosphate geranylgeranyltransferase